MSALHSDGTTDAVDSLFEPRTTAWFRVRLTLRLAVPLDRHARTVALKVTCSAALAAPPITIALIAPEAKLTVSTVLGLFCAGLPGFAATAWTAAGLRETRLLTLRGLRQVGAEQRLAWLIAAARLSLFAGIGALAGCVALALTHAPLGAVAPRHSPLRGMFAADTSSWLNGGALTVMLLISGALLASSPMWTSADWARFAIWRRVSTSHPTSPADPQSQPQLQPQPQPPMRLRLRLHRGLARLKTPRLTDRRGSRRPR